MNAMNASLFAMHAWLYICMCVVWCDVMTYGGVLACMYTCLRVCYIMHVCDVCKCYVIVVVHVCNVIYVCM